MIKKFFRRILPRSLWGVSGIGEEDAIVDLPKGIKPLPLHRGREVIQRTHAPRRKQQSVTGSRMAQQPGSSAFMRRAAARPLLESSRVVVTGGAGFIGSALVRALNLRGVTDILVVDNLGEDDKWRNLVPLDYTDFIRAGDFLQKVTSDPEYYGGIQTVFHLGACSSTTEKDADYLLRNNFQYSKALCEWANDQEMRFVYASSAATYGDGARGMSDLAELQSLRPLNMYGYSKQMFDLWAEKQGLLSRIVGLKYFNVFGPNEYHKGEMRSLVCKAYEQICATGKLRLFRSHRPDYKDGEQMRDFVYVKDAVAMTIFLAEAPKAAGLYNIGSGKARTWLDLARSIFRSLGIPENIEFIDMPETIRDQYQYYTVADLQRLEALDYPLTPTPLETAIEDYVSNYLSPGCRLGDEGTAAPALPFPQCYPQTSVSVR